MSLVAALNIALSGLQTASTRLEVASSNIANASVEGYTRKTAQLASVTLGSAGSGVSVVGFTRSTNAALFRTLSTSTTAAGKLDVQNEYMQKTLDLLGISSSDQPPLATTTTAFINSWTQLSSSPESTVNQQQVVQAANNMATEIQRLAAGVETLDRNCVSETKSTLADLNSYLTQLQDLNSKISLLTTSNMSPGGLEDERDTLILNIASMMSVTTMERNNGQIALYTQAGYQLVDGSSVAQFAYDGTDITEVRNTTVLLNETLVGGSLEGLIDFRATTSPVSTDSGTSVIQKLRSQLDQITDNFLTLTTTATSGEATFAAAYNNASTSGDAVSSQYLLSDAMRLTATTAGAAGNSISYTIDNGTAAGTYKITITDGTTTEVADDVNMGTGPYDWTAMVNAITAIPSTLVTAATHGAATLDITTITLPASYTLYGGTEASTPGELATDFFTGTDRTNIAVNAALLDGTSTIKLASAGDITSSLLDSTRVLTADGLSAAGSNYRTVVTSVMAKFQQDAKNLATLSSTATEQTDYLQEKLVNETGVNTDEEMVQLITLQQAYTASARVMTVTTELFDILTSIR